MTGHQTTLFGKKDYLNKQFPSTRYQGSKVKIIDWLWSILETNNFESMLDAFGGTGVVSYKAKKYDKCVTYNDKLKFSHQVGLALIENDSTRISNSEIDWIISPHSTIKYQSFIQKTFKDIYFTDEENKWLDRTITNIRQLDNIYKRALAFAILGQACLVKRPYNLFHRSNLYMRLATVERSFGNKTTWERPFPELFRQFAKEYSKAIFSNEKQCQALNKDVMDIPSDPYDLVYLDPPYYSGKTGECNYHYYYHFLEGMLDYDTWHTRIDTSVKTKCIKFPKEVWYDKKKITRGFEDLLKKFQDSILAISYNTQGIPSKEELISMIQSYKSKVSYHTHAYQYVLSPKKKVEEILLIGRN